MVLLTLQWIFLMLLEHTCFLTEFYESHFYKIRLLKNF